MIDVHRSRSGLGFTITEVVVAIAVIGIVTALLVPSVKHLRSHVRTSQGRTNLYEIGQALYAYTIDHQSTLPIGSRDIHPETDWSILLNSYMTGTGDTYSQVLDTNGIPQTLPIFRDPNATFPDSGFLHYSAHPVLMPDYDHIADQEVAWTTYKLARIRRPSEVVLIMDATQHPSNVVPHTSLATTKLIDNQTLAPSATDRFPAYLFYDPAATDNNDLIDPGPNDDTATNAGNIRWRQYGNTAANFLFPDGQSKTLKIEEVIKRNIRVDP